jgi:hypothetical protein
MSGDDWHTNLELAAEDADGFRALAEGMNSSPQEILEKMVAHVLEVDREMKGRGLRGLSGWVTPEQAVERLVDHSLDGLPVDVRPSGFMWPVDKPFPWSPEECMAAALGYEVKWHGNFDDFVNHLPGLWEMSDGYAVLHQS